MKKHNIYISSNNNVSRRRSQQAESLCFRIARTVQKNSPGHNPGSTPGECKEKNAPFPHVLKLSPLHDGDIQLLIHIYTYASILTYTYVNA